MWYVIRLDCTSFCMCRATIFPYPFEKEGWGERWDVFKPLPIDMCSFEGEHSCNMFDMTSWWLPQPWGISVGMTPYPHCEFCFHKCKPPPHPLLRQRWIHFKDPGLSKCCEIVSRLPSLYFGAVGSNAFYTPCIALTYQLCCTSMHSTVYSCH